MDCWAQAEDEQQTFEVAVHSKVRQGQGGRGGARGVGVGPGG
jgi:hypothetical protein